MQEREGKQLDRDRLTVISAVLKHQNLLGSYLAGASKPDTRHQVTTDQCIAELLALVLDCCEAAEHANSDLDSTTWAEVLAASQPYLSRCATDISQYITVPWSLIDSTW